MTGPCAKQTVKATIIAADGRWFVGTNFVNNPQPTCPRGDLPTGVGYEMCRDICDQGAHAEVNAIAVAGELARGATLYLEGHTYACEPCKAACDAAGIREIVIGSPPAAVRSAMPVEAPCPAVDVPQDSAWQPGIDHAMERAAVEAGYAPLDAYVASHSAPVGGPCAKQTADAAGIEKIVIGSAPKVMAYYTVPPFKCTYCGVPSWVDPADQSLPAAYCHPEDHGEPDEMLAADLVGKTIVFTGTFDPFSRDYVVQQARALGANVMGTVSRRTDLVVAGPGAGSKLKRAGELGIKVIDGAAWAAIVAGQGAQPRGASPTGCGSGDFSIGGSLWPGLSKLIEENGEVAELLPELFLARTLGILQQTSGKLIGSEGRVDHWSGDLRRRFTEEIGDLKAAIRFFERHNDLGDTDARADEKLDLFEKWHTEGLAGRRLDTLPGGKTR